MWQCVIGLKKYMTKTGGLNGVLYKEHKPGVVIRENSIRYWCGDLNFFHGWEKYIPDYYITKITKQATIPIAKDREYITFDTKYLLSVFKSINESAYKEVLRK